MAPGAVASGLSDSAVCSLNVSFVEMLLDVTGILRANSEVSS